MTLCRGRTAFAWVPAAAGSRRRSVIQDTKSRWEKLRNIRQTTSGIVGNGIGDATTGVKQKRLFAGGGGGCLRVACAALCGGGEPVIHRLKAILTWFAIALLLAAGSAPAADLRVAISAKRSSLDPHSHNLASSNCWLRQHSSRRADSFDPIPIASPPHLCCDRRTKRRTATRCSRRRSPGDRAAPRPRGRRGRLRSRNSGRRRRRSTGARGPSG